MKPRRCSWTSARNNRAARYLRLRVCAAAGGGVSPATARPFASSGAANEGKSPCPGWCITRFRLRTLASSSNNQPLEAVGYTEQPGGRELSTTERDADGAGLRHAGNAMETVSAKALVATTPPPAQALPRCGSRSYRCVRDHCRTRSCPRATGIGHQEGKGGMVAGPA